MRNSLCKKICDGFVWAVSVAFASIVVIACSSSDDKSVAGGTTEDAGIVAIKDLNVAGVTQKGPFVKGSAVTVQGINCKTLELTDERFEGSVKSDKGDFAIEGVTLKSSCAVFKVTGEYRSELSGKTTDREISLYALTDLKNRENVNVNILTNLEYDRIIYLVTQKGKKFADAKAQAEQEVLAAFDIEGSFEEFENLNIFESGDGNAALLAVSVMMQGGAEVKDLVKRMDKFSDSFAESGEWRDSSTKAAISEWVAAAAASGELDSIRKNVEGWGIAAEVPAFEKFVEKFVPDSSDDDPNTMTDSRDGQTYKTVKIGNRVWMAENLNYAYLQPTDSLDSSSFCYNDSVKYCERYGRLYTWSAAMDSVGMFSANSEGCGSGKTCARTYPVQGVCPDGWHLPSKAEWDTLINVMGDGDSVMKALPAGNRHINGYEGLSRLTFFWTSTECAGLCLTTSSAHGAYYASLGGTTYSLKFYGYSVRCVQNDSTDHVEVVQGAVDHQKSCKTDEVDSCEYGTLTDERDGQTYKTVKMGDFEWMAENLNYAYLQPTDSLDSSSFCFNDSIEYCDKYGRLYLWSAAMDSAGVFSSGGMGCGYGVNCTLSYTEPLRGVCPEGWHLPSVAEWNYLNNVVYNSSVDGSDVGSAKKLKSATGWRDDDNGLDEYGFSAFPVGSRFYPDGSYSYDGLIAHFWGYGMEDESDAFSADFEKGNDNMRLSSIYEKHYAFSVRCVKD